MRRLIGLRPVLVLIPLLSCLALPALGCGDEEDGAGESATTAAETTAGASRFETLAGTGEVPVDGAPDPELTVREVAEKLPLPDPIVADPAFTESLDILIAASYKYYAETIENAGESYHLPDELIAYDGAGGATGPDCGGKPAGIANAAYCRDPAADDNGIVAWDESGLLHPLYEQLGDGGTAFIIGHEFAHQAQDLLGIIGEFPLTVEKELNADCLTGSLWGDFGRAGADYSRADIRSIFSGISVVGDQPGTPWQDIHAHGNVEERSQAFLHGFEHGLQSCLDDYAPGFSHGHR